MICCTVACGRHGDNDGMRFFLRAGLAFVLAVVLVAAGVRYVFPQLLLSMALDLEHWRAGLVKRQVTLPDGMRISYLEGGRGDDLILLHGFGADKDNFLRIAPFLEPSYHVIVPDLVGFGDSSHPAEADYPRPRRPNGCAHLPRRSASDRFTSAAARWAGKSRWPGLPPIRARSAASGCSIRAVCGARPKARSCAACAKAARTRF